MVVSDTKIDRYYFDDSVVRFFESGNSDALAESMYAILTSKELREAMVSRAFGYVAVNNWATRRLEYLRLVDSICRRRGI